MAKLRAFMKGNRFVPFLLLFVVLFAYFAGVGMDHADDGVYMQQVRETTPLAMALLFRQTWSARLVIEVVYFTLYLLPAPVWGGLNSLMAVLLAYSFSKLLGNTASRRMNWLACGVVCVYPIMEMISAGWVTTSCNYLWPLALGTYALTPWVDRLCGRRVAAHTCVLALLALVYAANADQMLAVLIGFTVVFLAYMAAKKVRVNGFAVVWIAILAAMALLYVTAPGPAVRLEEELARYHAFAEASIPLRVYNVFMTANWYLLFYRGLPFLLLALCVCLCGFVHSKSTMGRVAASLPLVIGLLLGPLFPAASNLFPGLNSLQSFSADYPMQYASKTSAVFPFVLFLLVWVLLFAAIGKMRIEGAGVSSLLVLAAGLCAVLIMAMVPSAAMSYQRYTIYIQMAMLFVAYQLLTALVREKTFALPVEATTAALAGGSLVSLYLSW